MSQLIKKSTYQLELTEHEILILVEILKHHQNTLAENKTPYESVRWSLCESLINTLNIW